MSGRPRTFKTDEAIENAAMAFWKLGYRDTSVDDLVKASKVNRYSLYSEFGDKQGLFLRAAEFYSAAARSHLLAPLASTSRPQQGLVGFFERITGMLLDPHTPPGCLMANTLAEDEDVEPEVRAAVRRHFAMIEDALAQALAKETGRPSGHSAVRDGAAFMLNMMLGLASYTRLGTSRDRLKRLTVAVVNEAIALAK